MFSELSLEVESISLKCRQVRLLIWSKSSIQFLNYTVGWRTSECRYDPEKGAGVGDDVHSCAFDGARMKIWGSPAFRHVNNDYGKEWAVDDIVSCLFSWNGEVSFWLNGENLGVAFTGMNPNLEHYPAASLAMDQHCCFNFGEDKPFR